MKMVILIFFFPHFIFKISNFNLAFWRNFTSKKKIVPHRRMFVTSMKLEKKGNKRKKKTNMCMDNKRKGYERKMSKSNFAGLRIFLGPLEVDI
jgi:hypothetical protein